MIHPLKPKERIILIIIIGLLTTIAALAQPEKQSANAPQAASLDALHDNLMIKREQTASYQRRRIVSVSSSNYNPKRKGDTFRKPATRARKVNKRYKLNRYRKPKSR